MKKIPVEVFKGGHVDCLEMSCKFRRECTNHCSAGDFRNELGWQPMLEGLTVVMLPRRDSNFGTVFCRNFVDDKPLNVGDPDYNECYLSWRGEHWECAWHAKDIPPQWPLDFKDSI